MAQPRTFLFLQGPHGPFFGALARVLAAGGDLCLRVGFTAGDRLLWPRTLPYVPHRGGPDDWPDHLARIVDRHAVTDIVLYGDTRPLHRVALDLARNRGLMAHVCEEGYLRPWWATYERGGANANSPLMDLPDVLVTGGAPGRAAEPPDHWGDLRRHVFWGAVWHLLTLLGQRRYPGYRPHRDIGVAAEARLWVAGILRWPVTAATRAWRTAEIRRSARPWHLCLLQLDHDAAYRAALPDADTAAFIRRVIADFAAAAPPRHLLVFKAHPLDDDRLPLAPIVQSAARAAGVTDRVRFVPGGKLSRLLDGASSVVTVSSTGAQAALFRGLPVWAGGRTVYRRPGLTSDQGLRAFFAAPSPPDRMLCLAYRGFLLSTSQLPGGFYSARGRRQLIRRLPDLMRAPQGPYPAAIPAATSAAERQHLSALDPTRTARE
ncbi:MAG: capsule biosynthesis protein CapA [Rhodobacteraceae bacterium]|jgi:capsular polysaccharide export protein|nr:capsule biosynthesis protein CapA [Paracoccaceae bacterium]